MTRTEKHRIKMFWKWFSEHAYKIERLSEDPEMFDKLMFELRKIDQRLEILHTKEGENNILYISCGGIYDASNIVENVVIASPKLEGWKILAFKPRLADSEFQDSNDVITYKGKYEVDPFTAKMKMTKKEGKYDLCIYSPKNKQSKEYVEAYFLLLDLLIGEYNVMTKLHTVKVLPLNTNSGGEDLIEIRSIL